MVEVSKQLVEQIYKLVESVKVDGRLRKGTNETTKSIEKGEAQLVITAEDVSPKEIIMHFPVLCKEKNIPFVYIPSKSELGAAAGLPVSTSSIAIVNPGDAKKQLLDVIKDIQNLEKASVKAPEPAKDTTEQSSAVSSEKSEGAPKEEKPVEKKESPKKEEKPAEEKAPEPETPDASAKSTDEGKEVKEEKEPAKEKVEEKK